MLGRFISVLHAFCCHSSIILIHFYWLLLQKSVLRFPALLSRVLRKPVIWILSKLNWLVATWCGIWVWGISKHITNSFISFLFLFTYILLLHSSFAGIFLNRSFVYRVFFNLTYFIFIPFILLLIVHLCFWGYSGRYSFILFV